MCNVCIVTLFTRLSNDNLFWKMSLFSQGDEVIEWNGRSLRGATFEEVCDIVLESKQEPQVELIVHRNKR